MRAVGPIKKEFSTKVLELECHTFDIGNAKYVAKYKKTVNFIGNYIQREYKSKTNIAKAMNGLSLPSLHCCWLSAPGTYTFGSRMPPW